MYDKIYIVCTIKCTLYATHCTLYNVQRTLYKLDQLKCRSNFKESHRLWTAGEGLGACSFSCLHKYP